MKDALKTKTDTVARNIRKIREFRNYTQDYLAAKLEISQNAYSKVELGYSKLTVERLFHIALILEVDILQLITANDADIVQIIKPESDAVMASMA